MGWLTRLIAPRLSDLAPSLVQRSLPLGRRAAFEQLERRQLLTVSLAGINDVQTPGGKTSLVPLSSTDSAGLAVSYSFSSSDPNVTVALAPTSLQTLQLNVSGTDSTNTAFSGTLVFELFGTVTPQTVGRIETLVSQGFYDGTTINRVIDGFVAQSGAPSSGTELSDEFNTSLTFNSPGLLAMANAGPDTADSEFFVTAIDAAGSTTPISLASMPTYLDNRYTIFGQLVGGFDTFEKIMTVPVTTNSSTGENSQPTSTITINSATLLADNADAVLEISAPASFDGSSATVTVTATDTDNNTSSQTFNVAVMTDNQVDPPFLGSVGNQTTTEGTSVTFNLTSTDPSGQGVAYTVVDPSTFAAPANATVSIDQSTGQVTLTPAANFTGTISLLAGVRASSATDAQASYDTQALTLTVNAGAASSSLSAPTSLTLEAASDTGDFSDDDYTSDETPTLDITAATSTTVKIMPNGNVVATATETSTAGQFTATLPAGTLAVGANSLTATATDSTGTSGASTALTVTYAPSYAQIYTVPGAVGSSQQLTITWTSRQAKYNNEIGVFTVSDMNGTVSSLTPGQSGYGQAALGSSSDHVVFASGEGTGATDTITVTGGQLLVFYLVQNGNTAGYLAGHSNAFFSTTAADSDGVQHVQTIADPTTGDVQYNWEDGTGGGDRDYNDAVITVTMAGGQTGTAGSLHVPDGGSHTLTLNSSLLAGTSQSVTPGDVGAYFVDDPTGKIGTLTPTSVGYAAAALASTNFQVLYAAGTTVGGTTSISVPAGKYVAFYVISSGTTADFMTNNSANSTSNGAVAMFSFSGANPDSTDHFRWTSGEAVATSIDQLHLHVMDQVFGNDSLFDDLDMTLSFSVPSTST